MNRHLQPLMSDYLFTSISLKETAIKMLRAFGKRPCLHSVIDVGTVVYEASRGEEPPCRDEVEDALMRAIAAAEPRRLSGRQLGVL